MFIKVILLVTCVIFQVLMAASMEMRAFWDIAPCNLGVDRHFRSAYCLHHQGDDTTQNCLTHFY
jgi:hypothetical protein